MDRHGVRLPSACNAAKTYDYADHDDEAKKGCSLFSSFPLLQAHSLCYLRQTSVSASATGDCELKVGNNKLVIIMITFSSQAKVGETKHFYYNRKL